MSRPTITLKCVADRYADKTRERIAEFFDKESKIGGLIALRRAADGTLDVSIYQCDPGVTVTVAPKLLFRRNAEEKQA